MKKYECFMVIDKNIDFLTFIEKLRLTFMGKISHHEYENLGIRSFAYPIRKMTEGRYISFKFIPYPYIQNDNPNFIHDLELKFKTWNEIVKFVIVRCK